MPEIRKQTPKPPNGKPTTSAARGDDVWSMIDSVRMLAYGQSGTGKTTFAATFPGPILWLLCSGGNKPGELRSINTPEYRRKITPRIVSDTAQFGKLTADARDFATTVVDHGSGVADLVLKEILGIDEIPAQKTWGLASQQHYGQQALKVKEMFRALLNLPGNVVIIAQERTFGGDDAASDVIRPTVGPAFSPSVTGWLAPACDYVVQTFKRPVMVAKHNKVGNQTVTTYDRGKGVEYCLRVEPHDVYMTKFRVPGGIKTDVIVDPTYDKVLKVINGDG
jgi:hypothetical protein